MKKTTKTIFIVSIVIALTAFGILIFEINSVRSNEEALNGIDSQVAEAVAQQENFDRLKRASQGLDTIHMGFDSVLVTKATSIEFIESIEKLIASKNLVGSINSVSEQKEGDSTVLEIRFSPAGSFDNLLNFLTLLRTMPYAVTIRDVSFSQTEISTSPTAKARKAWRADIRLVAAMDPVPPVDK